ncbi:MAG: thioredoxin domain-containing protein [Chitinophagaceae bacterium]|nr:thioredoxin domain-containing protein [Chitinophagaceae bacterium]
MKSYTNELINETSPYLLQHAHNPVNWYPWGPKAFEKARKENKMLIISIGYAACHWCHVMERESFMSEEVAKVMNDNYVCIKVDREERPDIDQIYMTAAQLITGSGGWPLNALALPNRKPFFAGTYFPKDRWIQLLNYFKHEYSTNFKELEEQANMLANGIAESDMIAPPKADAEFSESAIKEAIDKLSRQVDKAYGGLSSAIKFPMPGVWNFMLEHAAITGDRTYENLITHTLDKMAAGGIYDHVGGGFARYSTDKLWHAPHFEKMLYDNAQLISLYANAGQYTGNIDYLKIAEECAQFVKRELYIGEGFYSSLDADSEGEEGKFYTWTYDEINSLLGKRAYLFNQHFGITKHGNWENGRNIPDRNRENPIVADLQDEKIEKILDECKAILLKERTKRVRPATDDKILTSWNAMMITALINLYKATGNKEHYHLAESTLKFLLKAMFPKDHNQLYRNYQQQRASVNGFLDDYAFLINALIQFYQVSFDINYLTKAKELTDYTLSNFFDEPSGLFFYNDKDFNELISRQKELTDDVIPASNSVMADNLFMLGLYYDEAPYSDKAAHMVKSVLPGIEAQAAYYSNWGRVLLKLVYPPSEVAIVGKESQNFAHAIQKQYLPGSLFCGSTSEENLPLLEFKYKKDETLIYVCHNKACKAPTGDVQIALAELTSEK